MMFKKKSLKIYSEMLVVVNDFQFLRNADDEAFGAFLSYLKSNKNKITHFVVNGDVVDMEQANKFQYTYDMTGTMKDEIAAVRWFVETMTNLLPNAKKVFIMGNHDARWTNYIANRTDGLEEWVKTPEEVFGLNDNSWQVIPYGKGKFYKWHDRIFWHGWKAGDKSDIAKRELLDAGISVTTGHINRNMYREERDALGNLKIGLVHGGFSKDNLHFVKKANSNWSQGFGIYFWNKEIGEQPYSVVIKHGIPKFIGPDGIIYSGKGFDLRKTIGLEPGRGRPKKSII